MKLSQTTRASRFRPPHPARPVEPVAPELDLFDRVGRRLGSIVAPRGSVSLRPNAATLYLRREHPA